MIDKFKEFKISSWAIDNRTSVYVLTVIITLFGIFSYQALPKEQFPDIVIPTIFVTTFYNGTSPLDMENLVSKPLEKQLKGISGVNKMTSNSLQDFSNVVEMCIRDRYYAKAPIVNFPNFGNVVYSILEAEMCIRDSVKYYCY